MNWPPVRCCSCGGWVSRDCLLCRGLPEPAFTVELLARCRAAVDRAVNNYEFLTGTLGPVASYA
jgi:hypothetical protein